MSIHCVYFLRRVMCLFLFLSMNIQAQTRPALPEQIWIFDNNEKPVQYLKLTHSHPIHYYNLDQTETFEQQFSIGLPSSPSAAAEQAVNRIQKLSPSQLEQFKQSYTGIVTAFQMRIRQLPAIVFEYQGKQFVVYGQQQASRALQEFQQWQLNH